MNALVFSCFIVLSAANISISERNITSDSFKNNSNIHTSPSGSVKSPFTFPNVPEDALLHITQLIPKYGYPLEVHEVTTEDGYILTLHRIPHGKKHSGRGRRRPAALLMHGVLSSSDDWVVLGPGHGLGYILADAGYDVWMGNVRGNKHSKRHVRLSPGKLKFWRFTLDEISLIDIPAMVDRVVEVSGERQVFYVGHSQGTLAFFMAHSAKPEYNRKVRRAIMLAPVAYGQHIKSAAMIALLALSTKIQQLTAELFGTGEFLASAPIMSLMYAILCNEQFPLLAEVCMDIMFTVAGFDRPQFNKTNLPVILGHAPAGCSIRQFVHYGQLYADARFGMFDYGRKENTRRYNSPHPPDYSFTKITAPVFLIHSENDWLAAPEDVELLFKSLPNVEKYLVPYSDFTHTDFLWANDVKKLVYDEVLNAMKNF